MERIDRVFRKTRGVCALTFRLEFNGVKPIERIRSRHYVIYIATITTANAVIKRVSSIGFKYERNSSTFFFHINEEAVTWQGGLQRLQQIQPLYGIAKGHGCIFYFDNTQYILNCVTIHVSKF